MLGQGRPALRNPREKIEQRKGEQVDVFMWQPHAALIECRWEKKPLEVEVVSILRRKLAKRPSSVVGLYVSMSGFTQGAKEDVRDARDRTVFLVERDNVHALAEGTLTFQEFWDAKMRALITQYPG